MAPKDLSKKEQKSTRSQSKVFLGLRGFSVLGDTCRVERPRGPVWRAGSWPGVCRPSTAGLSALLEVDTARCRSQGLAFALAKRVFSCSELHHVEVIWALGRAFPS